MARGSTRNLTLVAAVAAALACVACVAATAGAASSAFPDDNGKLVYSAFRDAGDGNTRSEILIMRPDGTGQAQLTNNSSSGAPAFSPDGSEIAYSGGRNGSPGSERGIRVMDRMGNASESLTTGIDYAATYSPDGSKIAFVRQTESTPPGGGTDYQIDIWVMDSDGSNQRNLTRDLASEDDPSWSPDGTRIAYSRITRGRYDIWLMSPDGSDRENVTETREFAELEPDWSPGGRRLAFASNRDYREYDIYTAKPDGTRVRNITDSRTVSEQEPSWSPDGKRMAYQKCLPENCEIFAKNADGSGRPKNLTRDPRYDASPNWGPRIQTSG